MNINFFSSLKLQDMPHKHMILYLYRKEWAFTLLSFLRHFPAKNWVGLRKPIRYVQIDIRNNLFISQFVDTKFRDLLICKCVQNNPTGRVGRKVKREKSQRAIARWDFSRCAFRLKSVVLLQSQLVGKWEFWSTDIFLNYATNIRLLDQTRLQFKDIERCFIYMLINRPERGCTRSTDSFLNSKVQELWP